MELGVAVTLRVTSRAAHHAERDGYSERPKNPPVAQPTPHPYPKLINPAPFLSTSFWLHGTYVRQGGFINCCLLHEAGHPRRSSSAKRSFTASVNPGNTLPPSKTSRVVRVVPCAGDV